jgi:hypothetical protein
MKFYRVLCFSLLLCSVFPILSHAGQLEDAKAAIQNEDFIKAFGLLRPLAEENDAEAQFLLGSLYIKGQGVEKDDEEGMSWVMKAARQGHDEARLRAFAVHLNLASQGEATSMYNTGIMCLQGWGGEQDTNLCLDWLETGAEFGHVRSAKALSGIYEKGKFGVTPDEKKASYWSDIAAFGEGLSEDGDIGDDVGIECREIVFTGSRFKNEICASKKQWAMHDYINQKGSEDFLRDLMQDSRRSLDPSGGLGQSSGMPR